MSNTSETGDLGAQLSAGERWYFTAQMESFAGKKQNLRVRSTRAASQKVMSADADPLRLFRVPVRRRLDAGGDHGWFQWMVTLPQQRLYFFPEAQ